jgi:hypothetical protein
VQSTNIQKQNDYNHIFHSMDIIDKMHMSSFGPRLLIPYEVLQVFGWFDYQEETQMTEKFRANRS